MQWVSYNRWSVSEKMHVLIIVIIRVIIEFIIVIIQVRSVIICFYVIKCFSKLLLLRYRFWHIFNNIRIMLNTKSSFDWLFYSYCTLYPFIKRHFYRFWIWQCIAPYIALTLILILTFKVLPVTYPSLHSLYILVTFQIQSACDPLSLSLWINLKIC